jgi:hypothetical protein
MLSYVLNNVIIKKLEWNSVLLFGAVFYEYGYVLLYLHSC